MLYLGMMLVLAWLLIYPFCDGMVRFGFKRVIRHGPVTRRAVCLTFDDGPDPRHTPEILRILRERQIPAVFFLIGAKAEENPDLVAMIQQDRHEIGLHTYRHHHAYTMCYRASKTSIRNGLSRLQEITGSPVRWFRPPWGACNLFQYHQLKRDGLRIVLWSANAKDWRYKTGVAGIKEKLLRKVTSGTIIVLHDSGGDSGAPANTVAALPEIISNLAAAGFEFVSLDDLLRGETNAN